MEKTILAKSINSQCQCKTLDQKALINQINKEFDYETMIAKRPHLFSGTSVFLSPRDFKLIQEMITKIEVIIKSKEFKEKVFKDAPSIAQRDAGAKGVLMGFDFHLTESGPKLIEINTNAGGAYLNLILARAQVACCEGVHPPIDLNSIEEIFYQMFSNEWNLEKNETLKTVAIIDENPSEQFLYPEFQLFQSLFKKHGHECFILDPSEVELKNDGLWFKDKKIDLVYNRLTDFYFAEEMNAHLKKAFLEKKAVFTPNPSHHALFANKKNLAILSPLVEGIPETVVLNTSNHDEFWQKRKNYFFKPASGYGSKAAYRGDKITTKVWSEIKEADYVAQEIAPPGMRVLLHDNQQTEMKVDLRAYTYEGKILLMACRLYSGQTTNFRTPGGGFAPVFLV